LATSSKADIFAVDVAIGTIGAHRHYFDEPEIFSCVRDDEARHRADFVWLNNQRETQMLGTILLIILILALLGALPNWPYSSGWGYYPSGGLGLIVLIVVLLLATGRL
jgi:hypothetical protein